MNPIFKNRPNELITTTDGRHLYNSRSVAVVLTLIHCDTNGFYHIAIEKRGTAPGLDKPGLWCLPCGYLDFDETGDNAIRREVWEEIGLNLDDCYKTVIEGPRLNQPWFVKTDPNDNRQNVTLHYGMVFTSKFLPVLTPNKDCEPDEVEDAQWASYSDILCNKYKFAFGHDDVIKTFWHKFVKK